MTKKESKGIVLTIDNSNYPDPDILRLLKAFLEYTKGCDDLPSFVFIWLKCVLDIFAILDNSILSQCLYSYTQYNNDERKRFVEFWDSMTEELTKVEGLIEKIKQIPINTSQETNTTVN